MNQSYRTSIAQPATCLTLLAACLFAVGCAGGSGSSGFNIAESQAVDRVAESGECEDFDGLLICPVETLPTTEATPTATPTSTRAPEIPTASPTDGIDAPTPGVTATMPQLPATQTPTALPTQGPPETATATATEESSPTPSPTNIPTLGVVTDVAEFGDDQSCVLADDESSCVVAFRFTAIGFPPESAFRVASRPTGAEVAWDIVDPTTPAQASLPAYTADLPVDLDTPTAHSGAVSTLQVVVLAFDSDPGPVPERVDSLGATGADLAFAAPPLPIVVVP